jgi:hypothetical protein
MSSDTEDSPTHIVIEQHEARIHELEAKILELQHACKKPSTLTRAERDRARYHAKREEINAKRRADYLAKKVAKKAETA